MKRGFLSSDVQSSPGPSSPPAEPQPAPAVPAAQLRHCLALLEGPADTHRLAGLLLLTKIAPRSDIATLRAAALAPGTLPFLDRLLLPLPEDRFPDPGERAAQEVANRCARTLMCDLIPMRTLIRRLCASEETGNPSDGEDANGPPPLRDGPIAGPCPFPSSPRSRPTLSSPDAPR